MVFNKALPTEILELLWQKADLDIAQMIIQHPNSPVDLLTTPTGRLLRKLRKIQENLEEHQCLPSLEEIARDPETHSEVLKRLAFDRDRWVRMYAASNPNIPPGLLEQLAEDEFPPIRAEVGRNVNTPEVTLRRLLFDPEPEVRHAVASNPDQPKEITQAFRNKGSQWARAVLAGNPNIPEKIFPKLWKKANIFLAAAILRNNSCPNEIRETEGGCFLEPRLSDVENKRYRVRWAQDRNTPADVLNFLAKDRSKKVQYSVAANPSIPPETFKWIRKRCDLPTVAIILENPSCPDTLRRTKLGTFVWRHRDQVGDPTRRYAWAGRHNIPVGILVFLSRDRDVSVRERTTTNPNMPAGLLKKMAEKADYEMLGGIIRNPNTPREVLEKLAKEASQFLDDIEEGKVEMTGSNMDVDIEMDSFFLLKLIHENLNKRN